MKCFLCSLKPKFEGVFAPGGHKEIVNTICFATILPTIYQYFWGVRFAEYENRNEENYKDERIEEIYL